MKRRNFLKAASAIAALFTFKPAASLAGLTESKPIPALSLKVVGSKSNRSLLLGVRELTEVPDVFIDDGVDFIIEETKGWTLRPTEKVYIDVAYGGKAVSVCFWFKYVQQRREEVLEKAIERGINEIIWHNERLKEYGFTV